MTMSLESPLFSRLVSVVWWISIVWLLLAGAIIGWFFFGWIGDSGNPRRHEAAIGAGMALIYSVPAAIGVLFCCLVPRRFLSSRRRFTAATLLVFCIVATFVLSDLAARYQ